MRTLDFLGLGAQKAGTSWLYTCLYENPEICIPIKDIHFFSRERNWSRGLSWYANKFSGCPKEKLIGEFSTSYLYSSEAAERIAKHCATTKLIVSLRDPVDRAFSHYRNAVMSGKVDAGTPLESAFAAHPEFVSNSKYAQHLYPYLDRFPSDQLHVILYEEIVSDPKRIIAELYTYLGLDPTFAPQSLSQRINPARHTRWVSYDKFLDRIARSLRVLGLHRLVWLTKQSGLVSLLRGINVVKQRSNLRGEEENNLRARLRDQLDGEVDAMEQLLGLDLKVWRQ